jgi:hypothetical protein
VRESANRCITCGRGSRQALLVYHCHPHRLTGALWQLARCLDRQGCWAYDSAQRAAARAKRERRTAKPEDLELRELLPRQRGRCKWCGETIYRRDKHGRVVVCGRSEWHRGRTVHPDAEPEPDCLAEYQAQAFTFRDAVGLRDEGVCAECGRDCDAERTAWLARRPGRGPWPDGLRYGTPEWAAWELPHEQAREAWEAEEPPHWHADHIVALEDGGEHSLANAQTLCEPCHSRKTAAENSARAAQRRGGQEQLEGVA